MSNSDKTEQATPHKLKKAKEKGDVPRSKELANGMVVASFIVGIAVMTGPLGSSFTVIFDMALSGTRFLDGGGVLIINEISKFFTLVFVLAIWIMIHTILGTVILGGFLIAPDKMKPKLSNLSLKKGVKKVISKQNVFESAKAILKLSVIGCVTYIFIMDRLPDFISVRWLSRSDLVSMVNTAFITYLAIMGAILIGFALIDVPFQIKAFKKKMMMSHKEVKDEFKQTEGSPEMKGKMKQRQREISERRHIPDTKNATAIITNPTHYSVALHFDKETLEAPKIVSMGANHNAFKIREIATQHEIPILSLPPLARSLYKHGKIGHAIPGDLYQPVAIVLGYLMGLDDPMYHNVGEIEDDIVIPDELKANEEEI